MRPVLKPSWARAISLLALIPSTLALGEPKCVLLDHQASGSFIIADANQGYALPLLTSSSDPAAVHIAAKTFAKDVEQVTGQLPGVYNDTLPNWAERAVIVGTVGSGLVDSAVQTNVSGMWEAWDARVIQGILGLDEALVITGSDKATPFLSTWYRAGQTDEQRGAIYGLYTLSEQMGVSPYYWWADVPIRSHTQVGMSRDTTCGHGEPSVKYRGFFINDEAPVLVNWLRERFNISPDDPQFGTWFYEPLFELCLRMKGNYLWPAMWAEMFAVDGLDVSNGLPEQPIPGPNQVLADQMGVVYGTSHQEPMARNTPEWETYGQGEWNFTANSEFLTDFWTYGAERAKGLETLYTVGMRGNGDIPLPGANVPIMENITAAQQDILRKVLDADDLSDVPQVWAMYKEVMGYFANGMSVPDDVTALLAEDNWGNLVAVMPWGSNHSAGGGIYYHADYVGEPRSYKWINTVPMVKMWEQLHIAHAYKTDQIWILNVGDMKMLELPLSWFMSLGYDNERWGLNSLREWLTLWAEREFALEGEHSSEVADILMKYQMMAGRRKAELLDSATLSLVNYNEAETVLQDWKNLEYRSKCVKETLDAATQIAYMELVHVPIALQTNLHELYISVAKSNLYSMQDKTSANTHADQARACFQRDWEITDDFHSMLDGKWKYMLAQPHINNQYWQQRNRNTLPPVSYVSPWDLTYPNGVTSLRLTVENSKGAWPGDNRYNCAQGYNCGNPTLARMDPYGQSRWVMVASGGPSGVQWSATANVSWVSIDPAEGWIKGDGSTDTTCNITIDWSTVPDNFDGAASISFNASDGTAHPVIVPIYKPATISANFTGFVEGDGYVVMEAAHHQSNSSASQDGSEYAWQEMEGYGRTLSGLAVYPIGPQNATAGQGPAIGYDFMTFSDATTGANGTINVTIQIGPSLNFIIGRFLTFSVSMDGSEAQNVYPIPAAALGSQPSDWGTVVANEVRNVTLPMPYSGPGKHTLEIYGGSTGIVLERVWIDLGGIASRGYSYLGPPESMMVEQD